MRIFHIITHFDMGGAERVAINIAMSQNSNMEHHVVELIRGRSDFADNVVRELSGNGVRFHRSWMPVMVHWHYVVEKLIAVLFPVRFLFLWLRYRPDVVHTHTEMPDMAVWMTLRLFPWMKVKVVRTIHNTQLWTGMGFVGPRVERFMQQRNANVSISESVRDAYVEAYGQVTPIIYNGVKGTVGGGKRKETEVKRVLFAGRFERQKGIETLCEIIERLRNDGRYAFFVHGSGSLQGMIDERLGALGNVTVGEPLPELAQKMKDYDFLIMPSLHEGLSILSIEASMNGLPVIINRCPGLTDTLPKNWMLAVDDNSMEQWMHLFNDVLPHISREEWAGKARNFALSQFEIGIMQRKYAEIYQRK